jgi:hypothetical protein
MTGAGLAAVGLLLCFAGARSIRFVVAASGFGLGWVLAESLGGSTLVVVFVALGSAAAAWVLTAVVFRMALLVVGGVAGAAIGAMLYGVLQGDDRNVALAVLFTLAAATLVGLATAHFHQGVLIWACAFGGAGLVLRGAARAFPESLDFLRDPDSAPQAVITAALWLAVAVAGWSVQRRIASDEARAGR